MFQNLFGIHEKALLLYGERIGVLASNLANADTPGYKARDIDFREVLSQSEPSSPLALAATEPGHISTASADQAYGPVKYRNPYQSSLDGNTVEMPIEQAAFAANNVRYQASLEFVNDKISELRFAIAGQ